MWSQVKKSMWATTKIFGFICLIVVGISVAGAVYLSHKQSQLNDYSDQTSNIEKPNQLDNLKQVD